MSLILTRSTSVTSGSAQEGALTNYNPDNVSMQKKLLHRIHSATL